MRTTLLTVSVSLLGTALAAGCASNPVDDSDQLAQALEQDNGGLDMQDEAPMFGDAALFETDADYAPEVAYDDSIATAPEVTTMMASADALLFDTIVTWGQMPVNPSAPNARNWSGRLSVNRGAIIVRRTIRFERATDHLLPRTDRMAVAFTSVTKPAYDGLILTIVDPTPAASDPLVLHWQLADGTTYDMPVADLVDGPHSRVVDADGNRITADAMPRPFDACAHGRLRGRWHPVRPGLGVFIGGVSNADGQPVGHIRGIYGHRQNGDQVFFGKYINLDGQFRGLLVGRYDGGHFEGRWVDRAGDRGALGGEYREDAPGPRIGGHFLGRWAELTCDAPMPRPPAN